MPDFCKKKHTNNMNRSFTLLIRASATMMMVLSCTLAYSQSINLKTHYSSINIDGKGFITSIKDLKTNKEYSPKGLSSALMSLSGDKGYIYPIKSTYDLKRHELRLTYQNGAISRIKAEQKKEYFRFQLISLSKQQEVDNIVYSFINDTATWRMDRRGNKIPHDSRLNFQWGDNNIHNYTVGTTNTNTNTLNNRGSITGEQKGDYSK